MEKPIEKIIVDILKKCLNLPDTYGKTSKGDDIPTVIVYGENIKLFNTEKLQIVVNADFNGKVWSSRNEFYENEDGTYTEQIDYNIQQLVQIDVYSRNNESRLKMPAIIGAFNSVYCEQQQDLYNFKLAILPQIRNNSGLDGGSDIKRYSITLNVLIHEQTKNIINYYDKFDYTITNDQELLLIFFALLDYEATIQGNEQGFSTFDDFDDIPGEGILEYNDFNNI